VPATIGSENGWGPRLAQEARLAELDALVAHECIGDDHILLAIERAALLGALNRHDDAKQAFISILQKEPTQLCALNEFGALLTRMGAIAAACRVYAEAILHHPDNPLPHINLANLLLLSNKLEEARAHYETALSLDVSNPQAHQGLGAVLSELGDRAAACGHFEKGFKDHAISRLPYRGHRPPIQLVQLVSSGGGNIPTAHWLDDTVFQTSVIVADYVSPLAQLPPHQLVFNAIGDADRCEPALKAAIGLLQGTKMPVINDPGAVMRTGRVANSNRLRAVPGIVTALTVPMTRRVLVAPQGPATLAREGFDFPVLLRSPGYHTGRNFIMVRTANELAAVAASLPGEELLVIEFLDARRSDGTSRKYRVMMIDGQLYPLHLAISRDWKVHYFTSAMSANADYRAEEARFLENMPDVLGHKVVACLEAISKTLGLDYAGVDFELSPDGDVLLFEANATMIISRPGYEEHWTYRHGAVGRAIGAAKAMIEKRSGALTENNAVI
jgi:glutathione synthase/RimK-type ligase-like ATP-grasp enzyme